MAVFGAPVAHEDDPERAVRAASAIREAIAEMNEQDPALDLHVRVGINTGEVLISVGADPSRANAGRGRCGEHGRRLQCAAPEGGILVAEATYRVTDARSTTMRWTRSWLREGDAGRVWEAVAPARGSASTSPGVSTPR